MWLGWGYLMMVCLHAVGFVLMVGVFFNMAVEMLVMWIRRDVAEDAAVAALWHAVWLFIGFFVYVYFRPW